MRDFLHVSLRLAAAAAGGTGDMFFKGTIETDTFATGTSTMQSWDGIDTYALYKTTTP